MASPNFNEVYSHLHSVDCTSPSQCWAVGVAFDFDNNPYTLTEKWDGSSWSIVDFAEGDALLAAVTCLSADDCWAAGYSLYLNAQTRIAHWNGSAWSIVPSPNITDYDRNLLHGISCSSASDCWAVGGFFELANFTSKTLIEHWDGASWSIVPSPTQSGSYSDLFRVTCTSASDCWAVGYGQGETLIEHWDGTAWQIVATQNQPGELHGVACASATDCWASGYYVNANGHYQTLLLHWDGAAWSVAPSPNAGSDQDNFLLNATCASPSNCWAVGYHINDNGNEETLILHWDGTAWSIAPSLNGAKKNSQLIGITCSSANECWAVGDSNSGYSGSDTTETLIERYFAAPITISSIATLPDRHIRLQGSTLTNGLISIEASPDLPGPFTQIATVSPDANGAFQYDDPNPDGLTHRFYRATPAIDSPEHFSKRSEDRHPSR